ncbi:MAG: VOC family protein [Actinomycetota bacterium]|nr:VOC family protein [Actinomycetota bacterium]
MGNPVVHFEVHGQHGGELRTFYADVFGWKIAVVPDDMYARVDTDAGGAGISGGIARSPDGTHGVLFYIQVPDIDAHLAQITAAGGSVVTPRTDSVIVVTAVAADPEGNMIGLVEG